MSPLPQGSCAMWLSVKPTYAKKILDGAKTVELRRQIPRFEPGGLVILYATSPKKAIVGAFRLELVEIDEPYLLWQRIAAHSGLDWDCYKDYFRGAEHAVGLHIGQRWKLTTPLALEEIREAWPGFCPPQSYRYVGWSNNEGTMSLHLEERSIGPMQLV